MNTREAKDFLVVQTTEQAGLEGVPLSDVEKRMMYFTESDPETCANPIELNDEFEAQYDTGEYEAKVWRLLHHARDRLKSENSEGIRNWKEAIRTLRRGDHYLLVLWDIRPKGERPKGDSLKLLGAGLLVVAGLVTGELLVLKYHIDVSWLRRYWVALIFVIVLARPLYRLAVIRFYQWQDRKAGRSQLPQ